MDTIRLRMIPRWNGRLVYLRRRGGLVAPVCQYGTGFRAVSKVRRFGPRMIYALHLGARRDQGYSQERIDALDDARVAFAIVRSRVWRRFTLLARA